MKKLFLLFCVFSFSAAIFAQKYEAKKQVTPEEKLNQEYCSGVFKSYDGKIFSIADNPSIQSYTNILDWLSGRIAGLQVYHKRDGTPVAYIRNNKTAIYVDEVLVDPEYLNFYPVSDIAMLKIIKGPFVGAFGNAPGGVIAVYTIKGDDEDEDE